MTDKRMYPYSCKNDTTKTKGDFIVKNPSGTILKWFIGCDTGTGRYVANFTNTPLAAGTYSIEVTMNYTMPNDYQEYTVSLYAPKKIDIFDSTGNTRMTNANAFITDYNVNDYRSVITNKLAETGKTLVQEYSHAELHMIDPDHNDYY